jgi:hypothetical protein
MESLLEGFYQRLGTKPLSEVVREVRQPKGNSLRSPKAQEIESTIRERASLLLHSSLTGQQNISEK